MDFPTEAVRRIALDGGQILQFEPDVHRYTIEGRFVPSVTQVLEAAKLLDLSGIPEHILIRAGERGTRVHQFAERMLKGTLDWADIDEEASGYVMALERFLRNTRLMPIPELVEQPLYCARWDYCGTPDLVAWQPRRGRMHRVVVDWKTGMMPAVRYQLAAYAYPLGVRQRLAVKLNRDNTYQVHWFSPETLKQDFRTFLAALEETRNWEAA